MKNFLIANIPISINNYHVHKFKSFETLGEHDFFNLNVKIIDGFESSSNMFAKTEKDVYWDVEDNQLIVYISDCKKRIIYTKMKFSQDLNSAVLYHTNLRNQFSNSAIELSMYFFFQVRLLFSSGICLHSAAIDWQGDGILFSAPSETGKTTQAKLWVKYENATIINGDRPALTIDTGKVVVHGTPWSGSDPIINNCSAPVKCIVLLEQAPYNEILRLSASDALNIILPRFFMPYYDDKLTEVALKIVDEIIQIVPIFKLKCLPDLDAVEILKKELSLLDE